MLRIEKVNTFQEFLKLEFSWNDLLAHTEFDNLFLTFEWMRCWWEAFGTDKVLFILLVKDETDRLIAIAPLMLISDKYRGLPVKSIRFIKDDNAAHADFIITERHADVYHVIFEYLQSENKMWDMIVLDGIYDQTTTYRCLNNYLIHYRYFYINEERHKSPYISDISDWESYISRRSNKYRKKLRYELKKLQKLGNINITEVTQSPDILSVVDQFKEISSRSWKFRLRSDLGKNKENLLFFEHLSKMAQNRGWLSIWILEVNGIAMAMKYNLKYKNKVYALRDDFDQEFRSYSSGSILYHEVIKSLFVQKVDEFDMCGDDYSYKMNWTDKKRSHSAICIFNSHHLYPKILFMVEKKCVPIIRSIRKFVRFLRINNSNSKD